MKKSYLIVFITTVLLSTGSIVGAQNNDPVWDVGTKWTYQYEEYSGPSTMTSFVTNTITDTATVDGLLLYVVESEPVSTGIEYFYYLDGDVYSYNSYYKVLSLLYDFENADKYFVNYRPICDPEFEITNLIYATYQANIDSSSSFVMPDNSTRSIQYATVVGNQFQTGVSQRSILDGIGFMEGKITSSHDWVIGMNICDNFFERVTALRCFENDSVNYNFFDFPCDSSWFLVPTTEVDLNISLFPNPTADFFVVEGLEINTPYELYNADGMILSKGYLKPDASIALQVPGLHIVRFYYQNKWHHRRIVKVD